MLFNSLEFFVFLAICLSLYAILPHRAQNRFLLVASYLFYSMWDWRFLGLILVSTIVDYTIALALSGAHEPRARRALVTTSIATNLGILGVFKYAGFFTESLARLLGPLGISLSPMMSQFVLPVGISFYTFQTLSYTIDVYRGRIGPIKNFFDFALFVAFFPQLVAGPIERASRLLPQIVSPRRVGWHQVGAGAWLILWGTFKKVVVADNLGSVVDAVYAPSASPASVEVLLATYAFAIQIYCDFSGYSDVARGVARLLGFELMLNFNLPYLAASPAEFWRRWHISLSTWLRDYLYISLGGNRRGSARTYRNLAITMVLGGLWHGAAWTFVLWGAYHGVLLVAHRLARPALERLAPASALAAAVVRIGAAVLTFHLICLGWLIFRAESFSHVLSLLGALTDGFAPGLASTWVLPFAVLVGPLVLMQLVQALTGNLETILSWPGALRAGAYAALFLLIVLLGEDFGQPFIYFQF